MGDFGWRKHSVDVTAQPWRRVPVAVRPKDADLPLAVREQRAHEAVEARLRDMAITAGASLAESSSAHLSWLDAEDGADDASFYSQDPFAARSADNAARSQAPATNVPAANPSPHVSSHTLPTRDAGSSLKLSHECSRSDAGRESLQSSTLQDSTPAAGIDHGGDQSAPSSNDNEIQKRVQACHVHDGAVKNNVVQFSVRSSPDSAPVLVDVSLPGEIIALLSLSRNV